MPRVPIYAGIALTTLATLLLELSLTRIFSVVFYYHFAFLAISIALFGLGAGGLLSYLLANSRRLYAALGWLAAAAAPTVALSLVYMLYRTADLDAAVLILVYFSAAAPFLIAGAITSSVISAAADRIDRVYFFDLLGAAAGCLLLIPLLERLGAVNAVLTAGLLYGCSSAIWFGIARSRVGLTAGLVVAAGMLAGIAYNQRAHFLDIRYAKGQPIRPEEFVAWNSFSRVAVVPPDASGSRDIIIDADADTALLPLDLEHLPPPMTREMRHRGPGFVYLLRPGGKTLVIGSGGGLDLMRALYSGSRDVTAVEINPIIANTIMRERFPQYSRGVYLRPEVRVEVEDGRSFVRRSRERYDVIQATLVDTWASTAAGAFALSENNLYTTDAFRDYLSHLTDTGLISFTRWGFEVPRESLRLVSLAMEALHALGERQPWRHIIVLRSEAERVKEFGALDTVVIARKPLSADDRSRAFIEAKQSRYELLYLPGDAPRNPFSRLLRSRDPDAYARGYDFDISPVSDDRPFFFFTVQPRDVFKLASMLTSTVQDYKINRAVPLLFEVTGVSILATLLVLLVPPLVLRSRLPRERRARRFLLYFVCLGVGYILVQVALTQKFVLLLGHPAYSLTVVIFSMLLFSGFGSYSSRALVGKSDRRWRIVLALAAFWIAVLALVATPLSRAAVGWPMPLKIALAVGAIAPAAFLMGMPFPSGLARLRLHSRDSVRWAWSLNAAASVMGSAAAVCLSIYLGIGLALLAGGLLYVCALLLTTVPLTDRSLVPRL